jgi:hypothetical protein
MNPDANGWYRVHANDGSGLDYSTTIFDPERHDLVSEPASDEHGRPYPPTAPVVEETPEVVEIPEVAPKVAGKSKTEDKTSDNKAEEATK